MTKLISLERGRKSQLSSLCEEKDDDVVFANFHFSLQTMLSLLSLWMADGGRRRRGGHLSWMGCTRRQPWLITCWIREDFLRCWLHFGPSERKYHFRGVPPPERWTLNRDEAGALLLCDCWWLHVVIIIRADVRRYTAQWSKMQVSIHVIIESCYLNISFHVNLVSEPLFTVKTLRERYSTTQ